MTSHGGGQVIEIEDRDVWFGLIDAALAGKGSTYWTGTRLEVRSDDGVFILKPEPREQPRQLSLF